MITALAPEPIPVIGTDGKAHVVYEVQVLNASPLPATITQVETLRGGPEGQVLFTSAAPQVAERTVLVGAPNFGTVAEIPGGRAAVLLGTTCTLPGPTYRSGSRTGSVPPSGALGRRKPASNYYPLKATDVGGVVTTSSASPPVIGPPCRAMIG